MALLSVASKRSVPNLAAFITLSAQPVSSVTSMDDALLNGKSLCYQEGGFMTKVERVYPRVRFIADGARGTTETPRLTPPGLGRCSTPHVAPTLEPTK